MFWALKNGMGAGVEIGVGLEFSRYVWANRSALAATWDSVVNLNPDAFMAHPVRNGLVTLAAFATVGLLGNAINRWSYVRSKGVFCAAAAVTAALCIGIANKYVSPLMSQAHPRRQVSAGTTFLDQPYAISVQTRALPQTNRIYIRASRLQEGRLEAV